MYHQIQHTPFNKHENSRIQQVRPKKKILYIVFKMHVKEKEYLTTSHYLLQFSS